MSKRTTGLDEIESAIDALPADQYRVLRNWFWERDGAKWDRGMEVGAVSEEPALLLQEAESATANKTLRPL